MRGIGCESAQSFECTLQTRQCVVEHRREAPEFVFCIIDRKPLGERVRANLPRLVCHGADRSQHAGGEEVASCNCQAHSKGNAHHEDSRERLTRNRYKSQIK